LPHPSQRLRRKHCLGSPFRDRNFTSCLTFGAVGNLATHDIDIEHLDDPEQRRRLVDLYVRYHRPYAVSESLFYGLDPVYEQVRQVIEAAYRQDVRMSEIADLAPDLSAPWRTPTLTVVYAEASLDLEPSLFVSATAGTRPRFSSATSRTIRCSTLGRPVGQTS
jgi:hypothetical protein